jgi:CRP/FNR family transcriptional regulator, anaerobic regulatory protein
MRGRRRVAAEDQDVVPQRSYYTRAGNIVFRKDEVAEHVFAVCEGWALRFIELADGRRQNLAVLLPGDLSTTVLFQERFHYSVDAVTDVCITRFARDEVKQQMLRDLKLLETVTEASAAEQREVEERVVKLGRRSAGERVCHLLLGLADRLSGHRVRPDYAYEQRHIADLTGLTSIHISRVLTELRDVGVVDASHGSLMIRSLPKLKQIAQLR